MRCLQASAAWGVLAVVAVRAGAAQMSPPAIAVIQDSHTLGEVALYDSRGQVYLRYTGLGYPAALAATADGHLLVGDREPGRIVELDAQGRIVWWYSNPRLAGVEALSQLPSGNLLVACGSLGVMEVDRKGNIVWRAAPPIRDSEVTGAVRLPDGSTMITLHHRDRRLFRFPAGGAEATEIPFENDEVVRNSPRCAPILPGGEQFLLWDISWAHMYRCQLKDGRLVVLEVLPIAGAWHALSDGSGGILYSTGDLAVGHWRPGSEAKRWDVTFYPRAIVQASEPDRYWISFVRVPDASWPESRPAAPELSTITWRRFWFYVLFGTAYAVLLHLTVWCWERFRKPQVQPPAKSAPRPVPTSGSRRPPSPAIGVTAIVFAVIGVGLAARGQSLLLDEYRPGWLGFYVAGAVLAAVGAEFGRRFWLRELDPFWTATAAQRPDTAGWPGIVLGLLALSVCAPFLYVWRMQRLHYSDTVGLWVAMLIVVLSMAALSRTSPWRRLLHIKPREGLTVALVLALGAFTLFYRLADLPTNIHFDYTYYALAAQNLLEGRQDSIWNNGHVPAPAIGTLPEMLGLSLFGTGQLGIRFGAALYGLGGIFAIYLLGRVYRGPSTGLLAAIFLAGNIPYMHFSRVPSNGEPATAALWVITLFALAVRYGHPGLWILTGLAAGYPFYLWPVGRPSVVACFAIGFLLAFRSWRVTIRRWYGPFLVAAAFAVVVLPLIPEWARNTQAMLPRVNESMTVYKSDQGIDWKSLQSSFGIPLQRSFGWFFTVRDNSSQGTLSPAFSPFEAVLLAIGMAIALIEGFSLNVLLLGYVALILITCGAWAVSPPWYTRLLPSAPIACLLMARAVTGVVDLVARVPGPRRTIALSLVSAAAVLLSPVRNFHAYGDYETGRTGQYQLWEMTAIGRRMQQLGPRYQQYLVVTHRSDWTVNQRSGSARFGELLPYLWHLRVREIRDLPGSLPLPGDLPSAVFVQASRLDEDVGLLRQWYPAARLEELRGYRGELLAGLVVIEQSELSR